MSLVKSRKSNFELLRIVAMFMVLVLHADFVALGVPLRDDVMSYPVLSTLKVFMEALSIVAVNVFVLISGWFGIRPSLRGIAKFLFQCLFFAIGAYVVMLICGNVELTLKGVADSLMLTGASYWFIIAYLCLYLLAPVLNVFIENVDKKTHLCVLVTFFAFQTLYAFVRGTAGFLVQGYSTLSFMGLYLLASYVRKHVSWTVPSKKVYLSGYLCVSLIITGVYIGSVLNNLNFISDRLFVYSNPLVVMSALLLLLTFARLEITSKCINGIGLSCFAVYLLHCNPNIFQVYLDSIKNIVSNHTIMEYLRVIGVLFAWFLVAIAVDQLRIFVWKIISKVDISMHKLERDA